MTLVEAVCCAVVLVFAGVIGGSTSLYGRTLTHDESKKPKH